MINKGTLPQRKGPANSADTPRLIAIASAVLATYLDLALHKGQ